MGIESAKTEDSDKDVGFRPRYIANVKNIFRFHDAIEAIFLSAVLSFPGRPYPRAFQPGPFP